MYYALLQAPGLADIPSAIQTPIIVLLVVLAIGALLRTLSHRYVKVPPEKALIIYGGAKTRVTSGGAKFITPFIESFYFLDLSLFQFEVRLERVPNKDGVPVTVRANVSAKISNKEEMLPVAAGTFGQSDLKSISLKVQGAVDGHVRALIGQSSMDTILRDQDTFKTSITNLVSSEMAKIGCEITFLNIQEVSDPNGVIESLGKPEIAKVKAEAALREAEQTRRQVMGVTDFQREAKKVEAGNNAQIAEADRDLKVKQAKYDAEVAKEQAIATQAGPLSEAQSRQAVVVAEVAVEESRTEANTRLQAKVKELKKAEFDATLITQANATAEQSVIVAEGEKKAVIIKADAAKMKLTTESEGAALARMNNAKAEREALELEGKGESAKALAIGNATADVAQRTGEANAAAKRAELVAEAEGATAQAAARTANADASRAELLAQAAGIREQGLAKAAGMRAELEAQAAGVQALLESFADLTPDQIEMVRTKWIIEALPNLIKEAGEAGERIMGKITEPIAAALGSIDHVTVYDSGSSGATGMERYAKVGPQALFQVFQSMKETGLLPMVSALLKKAGIDTSTLMPPGMEPDEHKEK